MNTLGAALDEAQASPIDQSPPTPHPPPLTVEASCSWTPFAMSPRRRVGGSPDSSRGHCHTREEGSSLWQQREPVAWRRPPGGLQLCLQLCRPQAGQAAGWVHHCAPIPHCGVDFTRAKMTEIGLGPVLHCTFSRRSRSAPAPILSPLKSRAPGITQPPLPQNCTHRRSWHSASSPACALRPHRCARVCCMRVRALPNL